MPTGQEEEGEGGVHDEAYVKGMFEVLAGLAQARDRRPAAQFVRSDRESSSHHHMMRQAGRRAAG